MEDTKSIMTNSGLKQIKIASIPQVELTFSNDQRPSERYLVRSSEDAAEMFRHFIPDSKIDYKEHFLIAAVNQHNQVIGITTLFIGTRKGCYADEVEVAQFAILTNASGILVCHNHPSGNLRPSETDVEMTKKIQKIAELFNIRFLDHLIVTRRSYTSLSDEGYL